MSTMEQRVNSLEREVAELKATLGLRAPANKDWESTVGMFQDDPLFLEAMKLGREYRESQFMPQESEGT